jgi:tetratricopeptide (TPR) repeat protein
MKNETHDAGDIPLAKVAIDNGRLTDALSLQEKAVQTTPEAAPLWHQLGIVRERLGMIEDAKAAFEEALRIDPLNGAHAVALARIDLVSSSTGPAQSRLAGLSPQQLSDPAVAEECIRYLLELGDLTRAFELLQSVQLSTKGSNLRLAAGCLAGGHTRLASMFFNAATERSYYHARSHCDLVPQDRCKAELAIAAAPWQDSVSAWEITFEIDRGRGRIVFGPGFSSLERRLQVIVLYRAASVAPLFWSVWKLRRRAQQFLASVRDTGLDGHFGFGGRDTANLIPDTQFLQSFGYARFQRMSIMNAVPWPDREPTFFWRGAANGFAGRKPTIYGPDFEWSPRLNLCAHAQTSRYADRMDFGITDLPPPFRSDPLPERRKLERFIRGHVPAMDQIRYRYLIDIDGWANSWSGLFQKLLLGATVLKVSSATGLKQWYYDRLRPFENHVPVRSDLSDLDDIVAWAESHPLEAERIAARGHQLATSLTFGKEFAAAVRRIAEQPAA